MRSRFISRVNSSQNSSNKFLIQRLLLQRSKHARFDVVAAYGQAVVAGALVECAEARQPVAPAMMKPESHTPHFVRPENRYCGRRARPIFPLSATVRLVTPWRSFAASHSSSLMMRNTGTLFVIHSFAGFNLETRFPVSGFFTYRRRFQTRRPTYSSLLMMPVPRLALPWIVLGLQADNSRGLRQCRTRSTVSRFRAQPEEPTERQG